MDNKKLDRYLDFFIKKVGRTNVHQDTPSGIIEKYRGKIADKLLEYWEIEGFRAYGESIVWTVNPDDYREVVDLYLKDTPFEFLDIYHVFTKTAFGTLKAVGEKTGQTITIEIAFNAIVAIEKEIKTITDDRDLVIQSYFAMGRKSRYDMEDIEKSPLFDRALAKLGPLSVDEVYAFDPLLPKAKEENALTLEHLCKRNIFEYIKEIRQCGIPSVPFAGVEVDYGNI